MKGRAYNEQQEEKLKRSVKKKMMKIETDRLIITELDLSMAESLYRESLDADNRRFVPDEVFETKEEAAQVIEFLIDCYRSGQDPQVYPVLLQDKTYIGYVQAIPLANSTWEAGYHIGAAYTRQGYATEALQAFLPVIMKQVGIAEIYGICLAENKASIKVMERCNFIKLCEGTGNYQGKPKEICRYVYGLFQTGSKDLG